MKKASIPVKKKRIKLKYQHIVGSAPQTKTTRLRGGKLRHTDIPGTGGARVFGPGVAVVSPEVAAGLLEMDRRAAEVEQATLTGQKRMILGIYWDGYYPFLDMSPEEFEREFAANAPRDDSPTHNLDDSDLERHLRLRRF